MLVVVFGLENLAVNYGVTGGNRPLTCTPHPARLAPARNNDGCCHEHDPNHR